MDSPNAASRSISPTLRLEPVMTCAPTSAQVSTSGKMTLVMIVLACSGSVASSRASTIRLNRRPPCPARAVRSAGAKSSSRSGSEAEAARAISVATSSAVLPFTCTAQATDPGVARSAWSLAGRAAAATGSAVVTTRPSTADLPAPGEPVTTSTRRSACSRSSQPVIAVSTSRRPRNRKPRSLSPLTPRPFGPQCRAPSGSYPSVHPHAASAVSPACLAVQRVSSPSFSSGKHRSIW